MDCDGKETEGGSGGGYVESRKKLLRIFLKKEKKRGPFSRSLSSGDDPLLPFVCETWIRPMHDPGGPARPAHYVIAVELSGRGRRREGGNFEFASLPQACWG